MRGRQQTPLDGGRNRRDLVLGRALARLDEPALPEALQLQLRATIEKEHRRRHRRPGWPELLVLVLVSALVGSALAWRYAPPGHETTEQVRQAILSYESALRPAVTADARDSGVVDGGENRRLERVVADAIRQACSDSFAAELAARGLPETIADTAAQAVARDEPWPPSPVRPGDVHIEFLHRAWSGDLVARVRLSPGPNSEGVGGDEWRFMRESGRWVVDDIVHRGA